MGYTVPEIDMSRTALIVVDMQNDFVAEGAPLESPLGRAMIPTLVRVRDFFRASGAPVIYTRHVHHHDGRDMGRYKDLYPPVAAREALIDDTPGAQIYPAVSPAGDEAVISKHRYSGFHGTDLEMMLRGQGVDTVAVTGVTTEDCVHATARDAMFRDFWTLVVADACATYDHPDLGWGAMSAEEVHQASLVVLAQSTADVVDSDELMRRAGSGDWNH